ncbi:unnamed protein product [Phytophthora lilii]|uniref:Unnamed protein product n=1 Tax=Phytophthora lilii TaxID=2077276 RepID=A0A9W6X932_9STRA|nr:unnamed protein product [Phytophthora lilii]
MEKQLVDDRVVELETQLAQKRAVEREKEVELSSLRADQAQLLQASHVLPNAEFDTLVAEKKQMQDDMREMQEQMKQQKRELERAKEQCDRLEKDNATLADEAKQLRQKQETHELETAKQNTAQDEEIKALQTELQAAKKREEKMAALLKAADKEIVKGKQRKEELKILYAKFSSTMDSVSEKTMRLEELEQELKDMTSNLHEIQTQKEELEKQVTQLQQEKKDMLATQLREKDNVTEELAKVQNQYAELKELESQQKELAGRMQSEIEELKAQNESLREQQVKKEHQSVGQPSTEGEKRGADTTNTLVVQVAEKEALQMFVQRYYAAAEEKCSNLLHKVSELESQKALIQEQTKESCGVLRMCTQIDSCDESVRASLLDVMATLEGLT